MRYWYPDPNIVVAVDAAGTRMESLPPIVAPSKHPALQGICSKRSGARARSKVEIRARFPGQPTFEQATPPLVSRCTCYHCFLLAHVIPAQPFLISSELFLAHHKGSHAKPEWRKWYDSPPPFTDQKPSLRFGMISLTVKLFQIILIFKIVFWGTEQRPEDGLRPPETLLNCNVTRLFHTLAMFKSKQSTGRVLTLKPHRYICKHRASAVGQSDFWELTPKIILGQVCGQQRPPSKDISLKYAHSPRNLYGLTVCCQTFCQVKKEPKIAFCKSAKPNVFYLWNRLLFSCFIVTFWCFSGQVLVVQRSWPLLVTCAMWPRGGWQLKSFRWGENTTGLLAADNTPDKTLISDLTETSQK